jgi:hypothetical protein
MRHLYLSSRVWQTVRLPQCHRLGRTVCEMAREGVSTAASLDEEAMVVVTEVCMLDHQKDD